MRLLNSFRTIKYCRGLRDKLSIVIYLFFFILLSPLKIISSSAHKRISQKALSLLPEISLSTPYGNYSARAKSTDIAFLDPLYEHKTIAEAKKVLLKQQGVFVDVGANIGRVSIAIAKALPQTKVIAIEPEPQTFAALTHNVFLNNLKNLKALECACTGKNTELTLYTGGILGHAQSRTSKEKGMRPVKVIGRRLDDVLKEKKIPFNKVVLVKIDVEGAEADVLKGMQKLLKQGSATIIFEAWTPEKLKRAVDVLRPYGYRTRLLEEFITTKNYVAQKVK